MINYEIVIASDFDREKLVAEVWIENNLFAEIDQENYELNIQIYPIKEFSLNYNEFVQILNQAKEKLVE